MSEELVREVREHIGRLRDVLKGHAPDEGMLLPVFLLSGVADDVEILCDALEEANERIRELEKEER